MTDFAAQIISWINVPANAAGKFLLAPVGMLPGWLSNTLISAVTGVILLIVFKFTSNQRAIGRARDGIKADMLAAKLYKDSVSVTLKSLAGVFRGAFLLLLHSIRPLLVMIVPVLLLLVQMGLWYQSRPLRPGEEALVTVELNDALSPNRPRISIEPMHAVAVKAGPVRVFSKNQICFKLSALQGGCHTLSFDIDGEKITKELAVGEGFMRISSKRPGRQWADILLHPSEEPLGQDGAVRSISIDYPERLSKTSGTDSWVIYFFIASMIFALVFKPFLKVRI